jgi:hypothetical protein
VGQEETTGLCGEPKSNRRPFDTLSTEQMRVRLRPYAVEIYRRHLGAIEVNDLREDGIKVHVLDKEFGIDTLADLASGQWISIQEKYRSGDFLTRYRVDPTCPDFTQEYMNAVGTQHEAQGEWFKLAAQLYFYGWANPEQTGFAAWVILDKLIVERAGSLGNLGVLKSNSAHGRATFYAIPIKRLAGAIIFSGGMTDYLTPRSKPGNYT